MHLIVGSENFFSDILASSINLHISKICLYRNLLITFGGECVWGVLVFLNMILLAL